MLDFKTCLFLRDSLGADTVVCEKAIQDCLLFKYVLLRASSLYTCHMYMNSWCSDFVILDAQISGVLAILECEGRIYMLCFNFVQVKVPSTLINYKGEHSYTIRYG